MSDLTLSLNQDNRDGNMFVVLALKAMHGHTHIYLSSSEFDHLHACMSSFRQDMTRYRDNRWGRAGSNLSDPFEDSGA